MTKHLRQYFVLKCEKTDMLICMKNMGCHVIEILFPTLTQNYSEQLRLVFHQAELIDTGHEAAFIR